MPSRPYVSVVVPVYRTTQLLYELTKQLLTALPDKSYKLEIVYVDDGQGGASWDVIEELASSHEQVRGIKLLKNYGQNCATLAGVLQSRGEIVVTIDDDLQHPPNEIPGLIEALQKTGDLVYAIPNRKRQNIIRRFISWLALRAFHGMVTPRELGRVNTFRAFRRDLVEGFKDGVKGRPFFDVLLNWSARSIGHHGYEANPRTVGKSGYNFQKLVRIYVDRIIGFSTAPLRFASYLGLIGIVLASCLIVYHIVRYLVYSNHVPGFTFLAVAILFFSALQLLTVGIMGEYIAKIADENSGKPTFLISKTTGD